MTEQTMPSIPYYVRWPSGGLRAPFPYFGGKSQVARLVWQALGNPQHYIEPFFGSGAVLLARPCRSPRGGRGLKPVYVVQGQCVHHVAPLVGGVD